MKVLPQKFALKSSTDKNIKLNFNRLILKYKMLMQSFIIIIIPINPETKPNKCYSR